MNLLNPVAFRRFVYEARTEGEGPGLEAAAIGAGVFIGCSPFYGLHLAICLFVGWLFRLNRLKLYLASNISNPLFAPVLILGELQIGAWLRRGDWHSLTIETARTTDPWIFGGDLLLGSLVIGGVLGALTAVATWLSTRAPDTSPLAPIVRRAADRYIGTSITAWEFARGKLRGDPIYSAALSSPWLPSGGTLVDVGCGQGLMLALLAEAARAWNGGQWPAGLPPPPRADRLIGIETRRGVAALARRALAGEAEIIEADARTHVPAQCRAVLFFDVLHMMPRADQEQLLTSIARVLEPGGVILVREADATAGWRFRAVHAGNRLKALVTGNWGQTFHFRSEAEWQKLFERFGFRVSRFTAGDGTPFGNVLFSLTESRSASASAIQSSQTV